MEQFLPVLQEAEKRLGVTIRYQTQRAEDLAQVLPAQFEAGTAPGDVIFMWDWWVKEHADHAVDLKDIWEPEAPPSACRRRRPRARWWRCRTP